MHLRHELDSALLADATGGPDPEIVGAPLTDNEWAAIDEKHLRAITAGAVDAIRTACAAIVKSRRVYQIDGSNRRPRQRRDPAGAVDADQPRRRAHEEALAAVLTHETVCHAHDLFGVRTFRRTVLRDRLLRGAEVSAWIRTQTLTQGRPTIHKDQHGVHVNILACVSGTSDTRIDRVPTRNGSPVDRLRVVSEDVAAWCGSTPADTARWVLTGEPLRLSALQAEVRIQAPMRARSRIVLTVAPTCTPREVARAYRITRRQWFGRLRRVTDTHARLAVFAIEQGALPAPEQMARWNRQAGTPHRYRQVSVFVRDARHAVQRLTDLKLSVSLKR